MSDLVCFRPKTRSTNITPHRPCYSHGGDILWGVLWNNTKPSSVSSTSILHHLTSMRSYIRWAGDHAKIMDVKRIKQAVRAQIHSVPDVRRACPGPSTPAAASSAAAAAAAALRVSSSLNTHPSRRKGEEEEEEERAQARLPIGRAWCHSRVPFHARVSTPLILKGTVLLLCALTEGHFQPWLLLPKWTDGFLKCFWGVESHLNYAQFTKNIMNYSKPLMWHHPLWTEDHPAQNP